MKHNKLYKFYEKHPLFHLVVMIIFTPLVLLPAWFLLEFPVYVWNDGIKYAFERFWNECKNWYYYFNKVQEKAWLP